YRQLAVSGRTTDDRGPYAALALAVCGVFEDAARVVQNQAGCPAASAAGDVQQVGAGHRLRAEIFGIALNRFALEHRQPREVAGVAKVGRIEAEPAERLAIIRNGPAGIR